MKQFVPKLLVDIKIIVVSAPLKRVVPLQDLKLDFCHLSSKFNLFPSVVELSISSFFDLYQV